MVIPAILLHECVNIITLFVHIIHSPRQTQCPFLPNMASMLRRLPTLCIFSARLSATLFSIGIAGKLGDFSAERLDVGDDGAVEVFVGGGL